MNVEPAALLITRSIPKWLDIAVDLTEFMLAVADEWGGAALQARCRKGIFNAAAECVNRRVIQSWAQVLPERGWNNLTFTRKRRP